MIFRRRTESQTQLNDVIDELKAELDARDRALRRIRTTAVVTCMVVVIAAFAVGTLLRDSYPEPETCEILIDNVLSMPLLVGLS
jgi:hypothetical protein